MPFLTTGLCRPDFVMSLTGRARIMGWEREASHNRRGPPLIMPLVA